MMLILFLNPLATTAVAYLIASNVFYRTVEVLFNPFTEMLILLAVIQWLDHREWIKRMLLVILCGEIVVGHVEMCIRDRLTRMLVTKSGSKFLPLPVFCFLFYFYLRQLALAQLKLILMDLCDGFQAGTLDKRRAKDEAKATTVFCSILSCYCLVIFLSLIHIYCILFRPII